MRASLAVLSVFVGFFQLAVGLMTASASLPATASVVNAMALPSVSTTLTGILTAPSRPTDAPNATPHSFSIIGMSALDGSGFVSAAEPTAPPAPAHVSENAGQKAGALSHRWLYAGYANKSYGRADAEDVKATDLLVGFGLVTPSYAVPRDTGFGLFPKLPIELRRLIWTAYLQQQQRIITININPERGGPGNEGSYKIEVQKRHRHSKLLRICREVRTVALEFFSIRIPCTNLDPLVPLYFSPECDVLYINQTCCGLTWLVDLLPKLRTTYDCRGIGVLNLAIGPNTINDLGIGDRGRGIVTDCVERLDGPARESFAEAVSRLQQLWFMVLGSSETRVMAGGLSWLGSKANHNRAVPVFPLLQTFMRLPKDPRPIERDLGHIATFAPHRNCNGASPPPQSPSLSSSSPPLELLAKEDCRFREYVCTKLFDPPVPYWGNYLDSEDEWKDLRPHLPNAVGFWLFPADAFADDFAKNGVTALTPAGALRIRTRGPLSLNWSMETIAVECAESIALLSLLHTVPIQPYSNSPAYLPKYKEGYTLSFEQERRLAGVLAFLSSISNDPNYIPAICLREERKPTSLNVLLAVNKGNKDDGNHVLRDLEHGFKNLFVALGRVSDARANAADIEQEAFSAIVTMCSSRILYRLRLKGASGRPSIGKVLKDTRSSLHITALPAMYSRFVNTFDAVIRLVDAWSGYQTQHALEALVDGLYRLQQTKDVKSVVNSIPNRWMDPTTRSSLLNIIFKVARYRESARYLRRLAQKSSLLRQMKLVLVKLSPDAFNRAPVGQLEPDLASKIPQKTKKKQSSPYSIENMCRLLKIKVPQATEVYAQQTRRTLKEGKVHAEIQLLFHLEQEKPEFPPRVVCSSKDACFLCNTFIKIHGKMYTPRCHGRLYPGWRLPHTGSEDLHSKFVKHLNQLIEADILLLSARGRKTDYPFPNESTLLTLPGSTSTLSSRATRNVCIRLFYTVICCGDRLRG
ncbi:hypothetical protein PG996_004285 [Apiospora saccharicola]|uniref:2EXR domain-containing protein n=1 Tax=Apiospora saccharicola TaxID=335842 RepID=A0ABR1W3P8_9PEZI